MSILYTIFLYLWFLISLPVQFIIAVLIFITSGLPIFYFQKRIGKNNKEFAVFKFRTMHTNADLQKKKLRTLNEANGPVFKMYDDPRFTKVGKFLSHTGLDELPQLFNILKGEMSIVGPRPLPLDEAKKLAPWMRKRYLVKPGVISPWIVNGYHSTSFTEWMKSDVKYAQDKNFRHDCFLFVKAFVFFLELVGKEVKRIALLT